MSLPLTKRLSGVFAAAALILGGLAPAAVADPPLQTDCATVPEIMPVDALQPGMMGTGFTVVQGRDPVAFDVEILGVIPDGIGLGLDFILVQTSGDVIEDTGGIAGGFSGSPVYIDGKLVGAIAYGFFAADQTIGGVTPAESMVELFDYPDRMAEVFEAEITIDAEMREVAAAAIGMESFPSTARALPIPLGVSGVDQRALDLVQERFDGSGIAVQPYVAGGTAEPGEGTIQPGESLSAALSYGDFTAFATGTATVCRGDEVVAFGHPFFHSGRTELGMNAADVLTVVPDPSGLFGGFKIATIAETVGTVNRDHRAGIRGTYGVMPSTTPITSSVTNPELDRTRDGRSDVVYEDWVDLAAGFHLLANLDTVFDQIGEGSSSVDWTITGQRADGTPFELNRDNKYYSEYDVAFESIFELMAQVDAIKDNRFEEVTITSIDIPQSEIVSDKLVSAVTKVRVATTSDPELRERDEIVAEPGDTIFLVAHLEAAGTSDERIVGMVLTVPEDTGGASGQLVVRGGNSGFFGFVEFDEQVGVGGGPESFDELLAQLEGADHNFDLIAQLDLFTEVEMDEPSNGAEGGMTTVKEVKAQPEVINGEVIMSVVVTDTEPPLEGEFVPTRPTPRPQPPALR